MMRARRKAMSVEDRAAASTAICARLLARDDVRRAIEGRQPIAVYLASSEEVDLTDFIKSALVQGASLVAPRWNGSLYELAPLASLENLIVGPHGIFEPTPFSCSRPSTFSFKPDIWLVPGLAFTKNGKRLGYGGGWYDRLLKGADLKSTKIGVSFAFQVIENLPTAPHDCSLTEIVTEVLARS